MQTENTKYLTEQGNLSESIIKEELNRIISDILEFRDSDMENSNELENTIVKYFDDLSNDLYNRNLSKYIPDLIRIVMKTVRSAGIKRLNFEVDVITEIFDLFCSEGRPFKKKKSADKRKAVMDAAMIVFSRNGFHETHVDEIAELAGVAKGTVYRYFKSKDDILKEIIKANNESLTEELMRIFNKDGHILELIKEAVAYYVEFFDNNKDLYKILTHSPWILKDISDHFYKNIISHLNVVRRRVFILTREGIVKPTDFYTVFYGIFGFIDGVIQKWFRRNCEYSLKDELPVIIEVLFYGMVAEGERKDTYV
ncbi:MAG: TetR/AcrR family transcriptional regulator [Spirochaetes bacterium]|nr:TetR/AcrR family transcriptional regulator [Spirochaetota bacterium]